jgi:hypothetical protein
MQTSKPQPQSACPIAASLILRRRSVLSALKPQRKPLEPVSFALASPEASTSDESPFQPGTRKKKVQYLGLCGRGGGASSANLFKNHRQSVMQKT